jgi:nucleotide-binding universal stress UspA family protein
MKVLIAFDGSEQGMLAVDEAAARCWATGTQIELLTVVHSAVPLVHDSAFFIATADPDQIEQEWEDAPQWLEEAADRIRRAAPGVLVTTKILEGLPKETIVTEARTWGADLIMIGSNGHGAVRRALLGSVSRAVIQDAPCSVELVRAKANVRQLEPVT